MLKKLVLVGISFIMLFSLAACNEISLEQYKIDAKKKLDAHVATKIEGEYSVENWTKILGFVTVGKTIINEAANKADVDAAREAAEYAIDKVEQKESTINFNEVMYDRAVLWRNNEFYKENLTVYALEHSDNRSAYYEDDGEYYLFTDESAPESRTFIIKNQDELENKFEVFPPGINFENEMLLLYVFTNIYNDFSCDISKIILVNKILKIDFSWKDVPNPTAPCASMPIVRWLAVKMNKLDITQIEFANESIY